VVDDRRSPSRRRTWKPSQVDIHIDVAQPARVDAYLSGGDDYFKIDLTVVEYVAAAMPRGLEEFRHHLVGAREFWDRALHYLTAEAGLRQFLSIGTRLPGFHDHHHVAQSIAPEVRFVYLVLEPTVLARAHELESTPEGAVAFLNLDLSDLDEVLWQAAATLDLRAPVGLLFPGSLPFVCDPHAACRIVTGLVQGIAGGSYVALTHNASDIRADELAEANRRVQEMADRGRIPRVVLRSHEEILRLVAGLVPTEPGLVPVDRWRAAEPAGDGRPVPMYAVVGRKP
jgi:S-adenosyl methyltransferase